MPAPSSPTPARGAAKRALARLLSRPAINAPVRVALKPFARILPIDWLRRVPIVTTARVMLKPGVELALESDGRDLIASAIYWRGLAGWEPETFAVLQRILPGVRTCLDVGASTGVF